LIPFAWDIFRRQRNKAIYTGFHQTFARMVKVHFLGLWDTVSSVGWAWNPQYLQFTANNPIVEVVRHAVALDERRVYFIQNLWGHDPELHPDASQVWFPGVHCDVGGGYKESEAGLSKIALKWMVDQAEAFGLRFQPKAKAEIFPLQDTPKAAAPRVTAPQHESLRGLWWLAEFIPKRFRDPARDFATTWMIHAGRRRYVAEHSQIHVSVLERQRQLPLYRPKNLPTVFVQVS
jgi:uncharacterized protein (DUF2235 family)